MHNTHKPRVVQSSSIDVPTAFHCEVSQHRTNIPFSYIGRCMPKAQKGPLQNQVTAFQCYKIPSRNLCPPLWQPPSTTYCHRSSQDHTRPAFLAPAFVIDFLLSKDSSVHFLAQIRIATLWAITVCCYLQICAHVHAARFGDVWNSFPGLAWALLRCIWDIVRQDKNQTNIDAQQNSTTKTCAL